jgi:hypothetical protein
MLFIQQMMLRPHELSGRLLVKPLGLRDGSMKIEKLKKRLNQNRPMMTVTILMPEDVVEDLKRIAPLLGFSGYQTLIEPILVRVLGRI